RLRAIFACEKSGREREIRDHAEVLAHGQVLQLALESVAIVQVVQRLQRLVARESMRRAHLEHLRQTRGRIVRSADRLDFALAKELLIGTERLFERRLLVVPVGSVEVDAVKLKST